MHTANEADMAEDSKRIGQLQDEIKQRDRRIAELRREIDELRELVRVCEEQGEETDEIFERWKETFGMEVTDDGSWTWKPFWDEYDALIAKYNELVRKWNKFVPLLRQQNVGRPLAASEAQCLQVRKLRKAGQSLRSIAEETGLGLNTVRTIVGKANGTDRTTKTRWQRIEPDRAQMTRWKRQRRTGNALPREAQRVAEKGRALLKEAKGLGRDG
jgi:Helix-turn-helix domain of resolvase